jgi:protease I
MQVFPTVPSAYAISVGDRVRTPWSRIRLARFPRQRPGTSPVVRSLRKEGWLHMSAVLTGRRIAILAMDGVEEAELTEPRRVLEAAGATVELLAPRGGSILAMDHLEKSHSYPVDLPVGDALPAEYDGLVLPGGVINADKLRIDEDICHGLWILIETGLLRGRTVTSYPTLRTDLENAGARWIDAEVHNDNGLVTSRRVDDLPAFTARLVEEFGEGLHLRLVR